ncbi:MAG: insulinase family protein, partial [Planctomycetaceae bacterium]|nr:insulinase family protein [Planctomycetaceae bacterium]
MSFPLRPCAAFWLTASVLGLAIGRVTTGAESPPPSKVASVEGITEYRLANGLQVLLFPDPSRPKVTVNLTVFVGSRHEGYGETGMAHLLEHMVFKGTPDHPDIPSAMKERGAQFNGSTSSDRTNYFETLSASDENLEFAIKLEADRMVNSPIKAEDLATEFSVVGDALKMGENSPERVLSQRMAAVAYEWHNYGKSTIGNRTDIERVPVDSLRAFYKRFYQPDNAMLVVAGKFAEQKALEYVNKYFGALPRPRRKLPATYTEEPPQDGQRVVTLRRVGDVGLVGLLYHVPSGAHPEFAAVQVLASILDAEPSGRLYKALVETKKATTVHGGSYALHDPGITEFLAAVGNTSTPEEVRKILL